MRVQTMFGRIASGTNEKVFGPALVLVRVAVGGLLFAFGELLWVASHGGTLPVNEPADEIVKLLAAHGAVSIWVAVGFLFVGAAYVLGVLTRPAGVLIIILFALIDIALLPLATVKSMVPDELLMIGAALFGVAGGIGNALGLNGIIMRNISSPGALIKFLFS